MLLLDTHIVVWLALQPERLSKRSIDAMIAARQQGSLSIAACSLWEIALLRTKGKIHLDVPLEDFLLRVERAYNLLALDRHIAARGTSFTTAFPNDPADRQIGATALVHGLHLVTADKAIRASGEVPTIW